MVDDSVVQVVAGVVLFLDKVVDTPVVCSFCQGVGCVCMLNDWISSYDVYFFYSRFKLKGQCRSEKWEVHLYGDSRFKLKGQCRSEKWEVHLYGYSWFKLKGQCRSEKREVYLHGYSRFKLKGQCRSEKWKVYLYGFPGSS